jgi:KipI family sensor histidine kinase inhibitor
MLDLDNTESVMAMHQHIQKSKLPGIIDVIPAARTILVTVAPHTTALSHVAQYASTMETAAAPRASHTEIELPVVYDGPDLANVSSLAGVTIEQLIGDHLQRIWTVAFIGFAPGFGYMTSRDWPHFVPRRGESRLKVPAGAIGLAGEYCGIYPNDSPGGWQIIGHTDAPMWDPARRPPGLLHPGARVRFVRA